MASSNQAVKPVSSRLLNMKFMQRPSPSSATSSPTSSKIPSSPSTPSHSKSRTLATTPGSASRSSNISRTAILAAKAEEASRREAAINASSIGAEERWSFSLPPSEKSTEVRGGGEMVGNVRVVVGTTQHPTNTLHLANNDDDDESSEDEQETPITNTSRRYFGGRTAPKPEEKKRADGSDSESDLSHDSDTSASEGELERRVAEKRAKKQARKHKDADRTLQGLSQIGGRAVVPNNLSNIECYGCGKTGHRRADCPNARKGGMPGGRGKRGFEGRGEPMIKKQRRH